MSEDSIRVLFVEDHQDTKLVLTLLLSQDGFSVDTAASCQEAIIKAKSSDYDVFVLDINLPDGHGVDLCRDLKSVRPDLPVIYYSAQVFESQIESALRQCGDCYLCKPLPVEELEEHIRRLALAKQNPR
jgi:two-component system phosphate regulon response regulator OmpR